MKLGEIVAEKRYEKRYGAYALIQNEHGEIAVIDNKGRYFLPGGGIELGEQPREAVVRECQEELGVLVEIVEEHGEAEFYHQVDEEYWVNHGYYFTVRIVEQLNDGEVDHVLRWLTRAEASTQLLLLNQRWAVDKFTKLF